MTEKKDKISDGMKMVTVIPLAKGIFKEELTYFTAKEAPNSSIVSISVRNKKILGIIASSKEVSDLKLNIKDMPFDLKKILEVKDNAIFSQEFLKSGIETSKYFATKTGIGLTSLIPATFREKYDKIAKFKIHKNFSVELNIKPEKKLFQDSLDDRISFYKILIRGAFAEKKSVFIILPTEQDINYFYEKLSKGIENFVFCIHGGNSEKKQIEKFEQIVNSDHPVLVLGTPLFLCIPRNDLKTIILENESSNAYKMIARPHFDLRIFVEIFASKINAKLIFANSLLRFETIYKKEKYDWGEVHPLSFRLNFKGQIEILPVGNKDISSAQNDKKIKKFAIFAENSIKKIEKALLENKKVFIFSLRKGLATMTICRDCGEIVSCEKCFSPVVLYLSKDGNKRMFICNKCGTQKNPEMTCTSCKSWNLFSFGIGTDAVFEELKKYFPKNKIFKLDKEIAKTAKNAEIIIKEFEENPGSILVGTEMALFYMKEKVFLSVISSFDSLWSIPNFKMGEKIIHLLYSIISKTDEKLIIQTKNQKDPTIIAIKNENILSFAREELEDRKKFEYPPFKRFIKISYLGDKNKIIEIKKFLEEFFKDYSPEIFSGFVNKQKGKYIVNALIKIDILKWSIPELIANSQIDQDLSEKILSLPREFSIYIDPEDLV